jgi:hypothetical protein
MIQSTVFPRILSPHGHAADHRSATAALSLLPAEIERRREKNVVLDFRNRQGSVQGGFRVVCQLPLGESISFVLLFEASCR